MVMLIIDDFTEITFIINAVARRLGFVSNVRVWAQLYSLYCAHARLWAL